MNPKLILVLAALTMSGTLAIGQTTKIICRFPQARLVKKVQPVYPEAAKQGKIEGKVSLRLIIGRDGSIETIEVTSGHPLLVTAAKDAVSQWKYKPTLLNGTAVEVDTTVDVLFQLRKQRKKSS